MSAYPKGHVRMTRFTTLIALLLASALLASMALAPASTSEASPIDHMIDCSDSFWAIACFGEAMEMPTTPASSVTNGTANVEPETAPVGLIRIDNDTVCEDIGDDVIVCHT